MARPLLFLLPMMYTTLTSDLIAETLEPSPAPVSRKVEEDFLLRLYNEYYPLVHRICLRYTKNRDEAEDLAQEVFLKVHGSYRGFEGNAQPSTWLYRVTVNHCLDHLRWRKRQGELLSAFADEMSERRPQESTADHPTKRLFSKLLENLDEGNRQVVMLRFEVGLTHEEIAEICGVSRVAITKRLARFQSRVQSLRAELAAYLESTGGTATATARQTSEAMDDDA